MFIYSFPTCDNMKGCFESLSNELRVYNKGVKRKNKGQNRSNGSVARSLNGANSLDNNANLMVRAAELLNGLHCTEQECPPTGHCAGPTCKIRSLTALVSYLTLQVHI